MKPSSSPEQKRADITSIRLLPFLLFACNVICAGAASLKESAPFPIGVGISDQIANRPADWALLKAQFSIVTPENCLKPDPIQSQAGHWAWELPDSFVKFALSNNLKVVGHCLVWAKDDRTPPWFCTDGDQPAGRNVLLRRMKAHIDTVMGRYNGKIAMWDVVNEALDDGTNYLRSSCWSKACGEEFIVKAFQYAHAADPNAVLIYNDYNNELPAKFPKMLRLIESLRTQNAPIDAIGLQGHYELDTVPFEAIEKTLSAMKTIGMKVVISPEILQRQAEQYARLFKIFMKYSDQILRVTFWDLQDGQSWLNNFPWKRANHPLLFDREGRPKPAYEAVLRELNR